MFVLGLKVQAQRGSREILATHIAPHASVPPLPRVGVALHAIVAHLPRLVSPYSHRYAHHQLRIRDIGPQTNTLEEGDKGAQQCM